MDWLQNGLFPSRTSLFIFCSYISLFVSQGLLVKASQRSRIAGFKSSIVVLLTEFLKLIICTVVHLSRSKWSLRNLIVDIRLNRNLVVLYLVPAFLYCLYNNLTFTNLERLDLATYQCLMQFRIVLTAIIYQILFRRKLSAMQWVSLFILTAGCLIKEYGAYDMSTAAVQSNPTSEQPPSNVTTPDGVVPKTSPYSFVSTTLLIVLQLFCSCFAGVYNEYLLKDSSTADVILQNMYMYLDSIICNAIFFKLSPEGSSNLSKSDQEISMLSRLQNLLTSPVICVLILNNALSGLVASFFLKSLNSIIKTFAAALELFAITFLAWLLFGDYIDILTILSLVVVTVALTLYSMNPVSGAPPTSSARPSTKDGFMLLPTTDT